MSRQSQSLKLQLARVTYEIEQLAMQLATWVPLSRNVLPFERFDKVAAAAITHKRMVPELVLWATLRTRQSELSKELIQYSKPTSSVSFDRLVNTSNGDVLHLKPNIGVRLQKTEARPIANIERYLQHRQTYTR